MSAIEELLASAEVFAGLPGDDLARIAGLAVERTFAADETILVMEQPADMFHVVRSGRIAVEIDSPNQGPLIVETVGPGDVLGISWLLPPYRWTFGARAVEPTTTVAVDAKRLREVCDRDQALGYHLYKRFAGVTHDRLVAARVRALDLYRSGAR